MVEFVQELEAVSAWLLEYGMVSKWIEGAIFPCEMAYFIARCELAGVRTIIESGRQDGYSTEILGRWAENSGMHVTSIDLEQDSDRAARCRRRLAGLPVTLIKGNAYTEVGRQVSVVAGSPTAILADGPKGWPALSLLAAAAQFHVRIIALHNLADGVVERSWFVGRGGRFYEDEIAEFGPKLAKVYARQRSNTRAGPPSVPWRFRALVFFQLISRRGLVFAP